jgi:hypothetical protein
MTDPRIDFRVIELTRVTDHELQKAIAPLLNDGWELDHIDYIKETGVRRPQMAFVFMRRVGADASPPATDGTPEAGEAGAS